MLKNIVFVIITIFMIYSIINEKKIAEKINKSTRIPATTDPFSDWKKDNSYTFAFNYKGVKLDIIKKEMSPEMAFESAAKECFLFYSKSMRKTEQDGLDIIDVCANPRRK